MAMSNGICVLGGSGAMGRVVVDCIRKLNRSVPLTIADRVAPKNLPSMTQFRIVDLKNERALIKVLSGHAIVINSTSHHFNLPVMSAALKAHVHYIDLGGLFHFTRRQLRQDQAFRDAGLLAILGMGCAPGISNLLARWGAAGLERVDSIHIKVGGQSWGVPDRALPYAVGTIREELTLKPAVFEKGRWSFNSPMSGKEVFTFPSPVGAQKIFATLHSEVASLPLSFTELRSASFKIGFSDEMIAAVLRQKIVPPQLPRPTKTPFRDSEITVAVVRGIFKKKRVERMAFCKAESSQGLSAGDWDTAWPPAIVAMMILKGAIQLRGVFAPENVVPQEPFFATLKRIGFKLGRRQKTL